MTAGHAQPRPSGWVPVSPCGEGCLPAPGAGARWRLARRYAALLAVLVGAVAGGLVLPGGARRRWLRACHRGVLSAVGVRLVVRGASRFDDGGGVLVVANHLSWVDVVALGAVQPVRMVAKREVRQWPLVGVLAGRSGAMFVDRALLRALPSTVAATADALRSGDVVAAFPEGTTWCGTAAGPFRRAVFQAAVDAGAPVRPVAVRLLDGDGAPVADAAFVGEQTLVDALGRLLRHPRVVCEVTVLPAIAAGPTTPRRELARLAGEAIASVTGVAHPVRRVPVPREASLAA